MNAILKLTTVAIGALPTYQQVGEWAGILLVTVRVVQGLAFGAEWGGAILMCFEHAPWRKKGLYTGITQAGFPVGLLLANCAFLASGPLGGTWAWRVPFLLSAVLIVVGILIRLKVDESPEFQELKEEGQVAKNPLLEVIRNSLLMEGIDSNWQGAFVGVFIVLAVLLEKVRGRKRE